MSERRPGSKLRSHAIVLGATPCKESDLMVQLLTPEHGRISAFARGARNSRRRFGAALDPLNHVVAHLLVPRESGSSDNPLWGFDEAEVQNGFAHLRRTYESLESGFFVLRLVQDLLPEGHVDAPVFRALGRFLRDSESCDPSQHLAWARIAFWSWMAHHQGFGDLSQPLEEHMQASNASWVDFWHACLGRVDPDFKSLFVRLGTHPLPALSSPAEISIYKRWIELSGIHWTNFERWATSRAG